MNEVPLHIYEKAKTRQKRLRKFESVMKTAAICFAIALVVGFLGLIVFAAWGSGFGWIPLVVFGVIGVLATWAYLADSNDRVLRQARNYGVIDE